VKFGPGSVVGTGTELHTGRRNDSSLHHTDDRPPEDISVQTAGLSPLGSPVYISQTNSRLFGFDNMSSQSSALRPGRGMRSAAQFAGTTTPLQPLSRRFRVCRRRPDIGSTPSISLWPGMNRGQRIGTTDESGDSVCSVWAIPLGYRHVGLVWTSFSIAGAGCAPRFCRQRRCA
jgi:hypothetical protein